MLSYLSQPQVPVSRNSRFRCRSRFLVCIVAVQLSLAVNSSAADANVFPGPHWQTRDAAAAGLDEQALAGVTELLGGRGCIVRDGYVVCTWGGQAERSDWMSSAKPVLSTLLFFALKEGLIESVDQPIADFGWELRGGDDEITFRHLGSMSSGFRRPENPGVAWAYNDPAIQLYQLTLFDKVFRGDPHDVCGHPDRFGTLGFEDGLSWREGKRRLRASVRDFARIAWFWLNRGQWRDRQLLPESYFDAYVRPQTPKDLPHTKPGEGDDYLGIGSYGGGSDHFTKYGAGIYGFNWWFNGTGRLHPRSRTWPDAPPDTYMSIGFGGNCAAIFPSLNMVLVCAKGNWGKLEAGRRDSRMNEILALTAKAAGYGSVHPAIKGTMTKWAPVELDFHGPSANASDEDPNPFLDYRLQVRFTSPSGKRMEVPGFFAGDGEGGLEGGVWRAVLSPDEEGTWQYEASFRRGDGIAVSSEKEADEGLSFDGARGEFVIGPVSLLATGFYRSGRLEYVGGHYLKLRDGGYWLKGGTDSPEDFLAYAGFANTPKARHRFESHVRDWRDGDPDWGDGQGRGIIGALNYLASQKVNSIYFLVMNVGGDGKNVYPWLGPVDGRGSPDNDNLHFDVTKLQQWGLVFEHAQRKGIMLHFVLNEAEEPNKRELDDGELGVERKLYYRELSARFAHFPALQWNLCEEYNLRFNLTPERVKSFAQYIRGTDPYGHPITVHHSSRAEKVWTPFLGDPLFTVTSFQEHDNVSELVENWRARSRKAGVPLVIGMDEFFPDKTSPENIDRHRREYLWPIYFSGGQLEFILDDLLKVEDFRRYERLWRYMAHARTFMMDHLPFWEMEPRDGLLRGESEFEGLNNAGGGEVFAKPGEVYAIYLPLATKTGQLDLSQDEGAYALRWFDPVTGQFAGEASRVMAGRALPLGSPPGDPEQDWVLLLKRELP